jgi:hypothetical protein
MDSSLILAPTSVRALNAPIGGAGTGAASPWGPRARRNLTRGGDWPSSEAEICWCGAAPLERSGVPPEGGWADCSGGPLGSPVPWAQLLGRHLS